MVIMMTMKRVNIHEAKATLSALIDRVSDGETVVICRRNVPSAELRPIKRPRRRRRPVGLAQGFVVPDSFLERLPDDVVDAFEGH